MLNDQVRNDYFRWEVLEQSGYKNAKYEVNHDIYRVCSSCLLLCCHVNHFISATYRLSPPLKHKRLASDSESALVLSFSGSFSSSPQVSTWLLKELWIDTDWTVNLRRCDFFVRTVQATDWSEQWNSWLICGRYEYSSYMLSLWDIAAVCGGDWVVLSSLLEERRADIASLYTCDGYVHEESRYDPAVLKTAIAVLVILLPHTPAWASRGIHSTASITYMILTHCYIQHLLLWNYASSLRHTGPILKELCVSERHYIYQNSNETPLMISKSISQ